MKFNIPCLLFCILGLFPQKSNTENVYMFGHSLINFHLPAMFQGLADDAGITHDYAAQIGIGANLFWNWTNPQTAQGDLYNVTLPTGMYDVLIMTEAIPLIDHIMWSNTDLYVANLYNYAKTYNSSAEVYFFETWHHVDDGTANWRQRLDDDLPLWEGIVDDFNSTNSGSDMLIIPGGQALAMLYDSIQAGHTPDLTDIMDVFDDNVHMNNIGNYYMACVYYATVYGMSPEGLENQLNDQYGNPFTAPSTALATHLQRLAWRTVTNYPKSGVSILPVVWRDFTAEEYNGSIELNWQLEEEQDNKGFEIEYSMDGRNWNNIGFIPSNGTTSNSHDLEYRFLHNETRNGTHYYRLKQIDFDLSFDYSKIISIELNKLSEISIYPNPATNELFIEGVNQIDATMSIANAYGTTIKTFKGTDRAIDLSGFTNGVYYIIINDHGVWRREKILICK